MLFLYKNAWLQIGFKCKVIRNQISFWRHKNIQNSTVSILVRHFFSGMERALFNQLYFVQEFLNTFNFSGMSLAYSNGLADGLGHIVNVVGGDPSHWNPGGLQKVKRPFFLEPHTLVFGQAHIWEHPNLSRNVTEERIDTNTFLKGFSPPISRCSEGLKTLPETGPHVFDPLGHDHNAVPPFLVENWVFKHRLNNSHSMGGWVGVHRPEQYIAPSYTSQVRIGISLILVYTWL